MRIFLVWLVFSLMLCPAVQFAQNTQFPWLERGIEKNICIKDTIQLPYGYERIKVRSNNFGHWLRRLPVKPKQSAVFLFDGTLKENQNAHYMIIDIDTGDKNLQQCADAVIRLWAEYLFSKESYDSIYFNFTSGDRAEWKMWKAGYRPTVRNGNQVQWRLAANTNNSYINFRRYLESVFTYAGSYSLQKEMKKVQNISDIQIGDVFIQGGFPGHAVIVLDMALQTITRQKIFLLAQSYMPAQDIHILRNPVNNDLNPWYETETGAQLITPEWTFEWEDLYRFK